MIKTGETTVFGEVSDDKYKYSLFLDPRDKIVQVKQICIHTHMYTCTCICMHIPPIPWVVYIDGTPCLCRRHSLPI